ncbi:MAG: HNH endonuclease signature motif containing protein [Gallionella sp.]|jgi:hypothetical protein
MTKSRGILKPRVKYTPEQIEAISARYASEHTEKLALDIGLTREQVFKKAYSLGLKKSQEYLDSPDACRLRRGGHGGESYRFPKGHVPFNKGMKGVVHPGTEATQFKKGHKPHTWKPIGSERICDGYLQRKMTETGYPPFDWRPVHILLWEEHNGPVPEGYVVMFKDKNKQNICIENLECISKGERLRRVSLHNYPKEVAQVMQLRGQVQRKINRRLKDERKNTTTGE